MAKYKRVLIKLSGEALGDHGRLFDFEQIDRVADVIRQLHETGAEIAIVIGAGNIWRGRQGPAAKMTAVNADHMGMLGTAINSIAMQDAVERQGIASRVMSAVESRAESALSSAGATGRPKSRMFRTTTSSGGRVTRRFSGDSENSSMTWPRVHFFPVS